VLQVCLVGEKMKFKDLHEIQKLLDLSILMKCKANGKEFGEKELYKSKVLALSVEVGELANETKCFKYWSEKHNQCTDKALEEYVDCLHFILSIGNYKGQQIEIDMKQIKWCYKVHKKQDIQLTDIFLILKASVLLLLRGNNEFSYESVIREFLLLGMYLGFTEEQIITAYLEKNKINYQRQEEGY
jgi:dimeric dUTPase (all-alpha-NTP-PPase superfamily)